jgi:xyloglucan-specific exo-beta-1,4-glucanase
MPYGLRKAALAILGMFFTTCFAAKSIADDDYVWRNVVIGGGGYIPNVVFSPAERGLSYLRSDMGGIYRWDDKAGTWRALQDGFSAPNLRGAESLAPDPKNPDIVYAAVGAYRQMPAAIIRSLDRGRTWETIPVSFRMGGNEEGRDVGERLAVDPGKPSILYFGSRYDGLQKSTDGGKHWVQVASFPLKGLGVPPNAERPHAGLSFVLFAPASGSPSRTIYVGNADPGDHHLYRSTDAGKHWAPVAGEPSSGLLPIQAALDATGMLYVTYADNMGPWGVTKGAVYKLDTRTGRWTDITPDADHPAYAGIGIDRQNPGTLVTASLSRPGGDIVWRTADGGAHWQSLKEISRRDVSAVPFLKWGYGEADFGWWITGLAIDPFDSSHVAYTTGATVYASRDLGKRALLWKPWVEGVEQTAVLALASPPAGPHLLSAFGDIGGYTHFDLAVSPPIQENPIFTNTDTVDCAGQAPNVMVRSGTHRAHPKPGERTASLAWSDDYGKSWRPLFAPMPQGYKLPNPIPYNYGDDYVDAPIAVSADGKTFAVATPDPVLTRDRGKTWTKVAGLGKTGRPVADRVDPRRFYAVDFAKGIVLVSSDGGRTFAPQKTAGLPADIRGDDPAVRARLPGEMPAREMPWPLMATPGLRGDLWYLSQGKVFHSTDGGKTFAVGASGLKVGTMAFGKAPAGKSYPALFAIGEKDGLAAIWRSDDTGKSWLRINDAAHEYFRAFRCIAADPRIFGRVYVGTDGRGIVYGEPADKQNTESAQVK